MKGKRLRLYEGMYILNATLSEDARKKALAKITDSIEEKGGEILKIHDMGKRRLAYYIEGKKEGYYYLLYFNVDSKYVPEMWQEYHLHEDLIRYMTLKTDNVKETLEFKPLTNK